MDDIVFSETYVYKLHVLTGALDKLLDRALLNQLGVSWSQVTLLLAINELGLCDQTTLARFLGVSSAAISRQIKRADATFLIDIVPVPSNRRKNTIKLTSAGKKCIKDSLQALEKPLATLFEYDQDATTLESHLNILLMNSKEVLRELNK
jgi:DNA-binding MarR family transcriptional regulator